jgi:UDPglucose 6-dehydrogenase
MRVAIVGTGYVGLVSGSCLAELGHDVICIDTDAGKIAKLEQGVMPIFEPGLEEIVKRNVAANRLHFTTSFADGIPGAEVISIAVGTPSASDGSVDMSYVYGAAEMIGKSLTGYAVIATKSTVPVGTSERIADILHKVLVDSGISFDVVSNPEFLREGHAVYDFLHPSRIIIGTASKRAADMMLRLYEYLDCPKLVMDPRSAEISKYAANAFLATKISFVNEISHMCEHIGADVEHVVRSIGSDPRIGKEFLRVGPGWGGSCFPKDVRALKTLGDAVGHPLPVVSGALEMNALARSRVADRIQEALGDIPSVVVGMLGIAFKGNTDDTRESPAIDIMRNLIGRGATVRAYDPHARVRPEHHNIEVSQHASPYEAAEGAHAVVIGTEWEEFRTLDLKKLKEKMAGDVLFDARNMLTPQAAQANGFRYFRIGKS